jgi:GxxExxY protein
LNEFKHKELSEILIGIFYDVYNALGYGFLEKVYENSFALELDNFGIPYKVQEPIEVFYKGLQVGFYKADIVVDDKIIIELKAAESLCEENECQLLNYLRATNIEVGLLFNFGKTAQFKRLVYSNSRKNSK